MSRFVKMACVLMLGVSVACTSTPAVDGVPVPSPTAPIATNHPVPVAPTAAEEAPPVTPQVASPPSGERVQPEDLVYLGAFRLPDDPGVSNWEYSGQGLTYNPQGDPDGPEDGFPGSLFGFGNDRDMLVSEISIPAPVHSRNLADLPVAQTLQPFQDISAGLFEPQAVDLPVGGLAYLDGPDGPKLFFTFGWHFQEFGDASHGWSDIDLGNPQSAGLWVFGGYTNYVTDDYLFDIPPDWAQTYAPGYLLASGRAREGPWSGRGPALFAYAPRMGGSPPPAGNTLDAIKPLLLYGIQQPGALEIASDESMQMENYGDADHWWGGAWLTAGDKSALVFVGTKAIGESWYGFANGVRWAYDCAEQNPPTCPEVPDWPYDNRGYWADGYQAQLIFYDPAELGAVARGEMNPWEPQPYAVLVLDEYLFDPHIHVEVYKRDLVGAAAFDRQNGLLFIIERLADEARSVVHVFRVGP
ncbi:MAG: hypothetical protein Fur0018_20580 [Anaerolineales bacterium]